MAKKYIGAFENKLYYSTKTGRFFQCLYVGEGTLPDSGCFGQSSDYVLLLEDGTAKETDSLALCVFLHNGTYQHVLDL